MCLYGVVHIAIVGRIRNPRRVSGWSGCRLSETTANGGASDRVSDQCIGHGRQRSGRYHRCRRAHLYGQECRAPDGAWFDSAATMKQFTAGQQRSLEDDVDSHTSPAAVFIE